MFVTSIFTIFSNSFSFDLAAKILDFESLLFLSTGTNELIEEYLYVWKFNLLFKSATPKLFILILLSVLKF